MSAACKHGNRQEMHRRIQRARQRCCTARTITSSGQCSGIPTLRVGDRTTMILAKEENSGYCVLKTVPTEGVHGGPDLKIRTMFLRALVPVQDLGSCPSNVLACLGSGNSSRRLNHLTCACLAYRRDCCTGSGDRTAWCGLRGNHRANRMSKQNTRISSTNASAETLKKILLE